MAKTKQQKRLQKKKAAAKKQATHQHQQNRLRKSGTNNAWWEVDDPTTFKVPLDFFAAFPNEYIGPEETQFLDEEHSHIDVPAYIYPAEDGLCSAMNARLILSGIEPMDFSGKQWIVVDTKTMLPISAFVELDEAKNHTLLEYPTAKTIRSNSLGLMGVLDYPTLCQMIPALDKPESESFWVSYFLDMENNYGFSFDAMDFVEAILEKLVVDHNAPQSVHSDFCDKTSLDEALEFISKNGLASYSVAINVAMKYEFEISRINNSNQEDKELLSQDSSEMDIIPSPGQVYATPSGQKIYIEDVWQDDESNFFTVDYVDYDDKDDMNGIGESIDGSQWEKMRSILTLVLEEEDAV
ncbi:hypothetical protein EAY39_15265 [Vibrio anguillarum]|uniref:hypothetical protein n=3 Tax=Vibrio anguillarum TaxID=55601 RepID=UPI0018C2E66B|nr:hypothetical protein [Vibrio anguillarum]MBF4342123.1 hypothetical protein [Vibrio anguillarum]